MKVYTLSMSPESEIKPSEINIHGITKHQVTNEFLGADACRKNLELARHKLVKIKIN
jgi:hypothetical protein